MGKVACKMPDLASQKAKFVNPFLSGLGQVREKANRALATLFWSNPFLRLRNAFKNSVFDASTLVSTNTLLLKHY